MCLLVCVFDYMCSRLSVYTHNTHTANHSTFLPCLARSILTEYGVSFTTVSLYIHLVDVTTNYLMTSSTCILLQCLYMCRSTHTHTTHTARTQLHTTLHAHSYTLHYTHTTVHTLHCIHTLRTHTHYTTHILHYTTLHTHGYTWLHMATHANMYTKQLCNKEVVYS